MIRHALLASLFVGAVSMGGCASTERPHGTDIIEHPHPTAVAAPDPAREARWAYVDPGGMWLPSQMLLREHVETLRKMGAVLDPKTLEGLIVSLCASRCRGGGPLGS